MGPYGTDNEWRMYGQNDLPGGSTGSIPPPNSQTDSPTGESPTVNTGPGSESAVCDCLVKVGSICDARDTDFFYGHRILIEY